MKAVIEYNVIKLFSYSQVQVGNGQETAVV
jgi:hypothetical protein